MKMTRVSFGLYFGRELDGGVRILKFKQQPNEAPDTDKSYDPLDLAFAAVISAQQWPLVVAAVSQMGEGPDRYYQAQAFHNNLAIFAQPAVGNFPIPDQLG